MKKDNFREILNSLEIHTEEWTDLYEIESIFLNNGRGIYPDWKHLRFLITKDMDILIKYGDSKPYGARLTHLFNISIDGIDITLSTPELLPETMFYSGYRYPRAGDILRYTNGKKVLNEVVITKVNIYANQTYMNISSPLSLREHGNLSFYDPLEYENTSNCIHSNPIEGIYMKFTPNEMKNHKKFGGYHELIKCKEISEIKLKVVSRKFQKIYSIK